MNVTLRLHENKKEVFFLVFLSIQGSSRRLGPKEGSLYLLKNDLRVIQELKSMNSTYVFSVQQECGSIEVLDMSCCPHRAAGRWTLRELSTGVFRRKELPQPLHGIVSEDLEKVEAKGLMPPLQSLPIKNENIITQRKIGHLTVSSSWREKPAAHLHQ